MTQHAKHPAELPAFFEPLLAEQYDSADVERIVAGCSANRPVTLRANTLLATRDEVASSLDAAGIRHEPVSWFDDAFIIRDARERDIWDLPIYAEGKVYLQSLSSMVPALVLQVQAGKDVCDMCAAPGGKTTQIAALTGNKAYITACEMHAPRAEKLEYNLHKLGAPNVTVMRTDARKLDEFFSFDYVLLDAPCSGSGTLHAGDSRVAKRFTHQLIQKSTKSQKALFEKALTLLKPGSTLVYSTCSVLACENEDIVEQGLRRMRKKGRFEIEPIVTPGSTEAKDTAQDNAADSPRPFFDEDAARALPLLPTSIPGTLCLAPNNLYEGFFVAKIKRIS